MSNRRLIFKSASFLIAIFITFASHNVFAADYRLITSHIPPWSIAPPSKLPGSLIEIIREADRRLGNNTAIEFIPWGRAQKIVQAENNILFFPLTRVKEREKKFLWVHALRETHFAFLSADGQKIDEEQAKKLDRILVHSNSLPQIILNRKGFRNQVYISKKYPGLIDLLLLKRVDSWFADIDGYHWWTRSNPEFSSLTVGPDIFTGVIYLAGSLNFPKEILVDLQSVLLDMRNDGTYQHIMDKYHSPNYQN